MIFMEFKKCERCGCFFVSTDNICGNCLAKEQTEIKKLKDYFSESEEIPSIALLVHDTGISEKNLTNIYRITTL